jgi:ABC-type uncharacterized transport system permease subunit
MSTPAQPRRSRAARAFAPLAGATSLLILCQAVTAGRFIADEHNKIELEVHSGVGYLTVLVAIATAVVAVIAFRNTSRILVWASAALAVFTAVQLVIGKLITDAEQDGWIVVHVPLALIVFGLTIWLAFAAARDRRVASAA